MFNRSKKNVPYKKLGAQLREPDDTIALGLIVREQEAGAARAPTDQEVREAQEKFARSEIEPAEDATSSASPDQTLQRVDTSLITIQPSSAPHPDLERAQEQANWVSGINKLEQKAVESAARRCFPERPINGIYDHKLATAYVGEDFSPHKPTIVFMPDMGQSGGPIFAEMILYFKKEYNCLLLTHLPCAVSKAEDAYRILQAHTFRADTEAERKLATGHTKSNRFMWHWAKALSNVEKIQMVFAVGFSVRILAELMREPMLLKTGIQSANLFLIDPPSFDQRTRAWLPFSLFLHVFNFPGSCLPEGWCCDNAGCCDCAMHLYDHNVNTSFLLRLSRHLNGAFKRSSREPEQPLSVLARQSEIFHQPLSSLFSKNQQTRSRIFCFSHLSDTHAEHQKLESWFGARTQLVVSPFPTGSERGPLTTRQLLSRVSEPASDKAILDWLSGLRSEPPKIEAVSPLPRGNWLASVRNCLKF